jgi:hypothetical protein
MKKNSTAVGCFRYAQFVFVAEIFLAFYWTCVLTYASVNDHRKLLAGLIFGLHYPGLIALSGLFDDLTTKKNAIIRYGKSPQRWYNKIASRTSSVVRIKKKSPTNDADGGENNENRTTEFNDLFFDDSDDVGERRLVENLNHYPVSYGVALFVAMISDLFSLIDIILERQDDDIEAITYYLYAILFGLGLCLTISSIAWSIIFYLQIRSLSKKSKTPSKENERTTGL